jgi:hypothetical protein
MLYTLSLVDINVPAGSPRDAEVYHRGRNQPRQRGGSPMSAVRVALTVVLGVALLGVALPAVDAGRVDRTTAALDSTAERIARTGAHLRAVEDPTPPGVPGARAVVTVDVPHRSWHAAGVAYVAVGGAPEAAGNRSVVVYRIEGKQPKTVPLAFPVRTPHGPLVYRTAGDHRLNLSLVTDEGVAVAVSRGGG